MKYIQLKEEIHRGFVLTSTGVEKLVTPPGTVWDVATDELLPGKLMGVADGGVRVIRDLSWWRNTERFSFDK